ncbi:MAG: hypothetical protein A2Y15_05930 [Clostridiales bacterium GWF2_36_10]|nr:MAG: hypothetical protein A2Y15_05930 [Clostridiales bacterium GWF2_36_10]HAN21603.1 hypothetical protein [Clostridiales bacterium]
MISITPKLKERLVNGLKNHIPRMMEAEALETNASDILKRAYKALVEIFGFKKQDIVEETSAKKNLYVLKIMVNEKIQIYIECKDAGTDLNEIEFQNTIPTGTKWCILTNGSHFKIHKMIKAKPLNIELVHEFDIQNIYYKQNKQLLVLYYLCTEAFPKK